MGPGEETNSESWSERQEQAEKTLSCENLFDVLYISSLLNHLLTDPRRRLCIMLWSLAVCCVGGHLVLEVCFLLPQ